MVAIGRSSWTALVEVTSLRPVPAEGLPSSHADADQAKPASAINASRFSHGSRRALRGFLLVVLSKTTYRHPAVALR